MKKEITVEITINGKTLYRNYKADEDVLEDDMFWGEEVVDMFDTIKKSEEVKF